MTLVCHSYVTRFYSFYMRISPVCNHMPFVCHSYILVCHSYATYMNSYVTRICFYHEPCPRKEFHNFPFYFLNQELLFSNLNSDITITASENELRFLNLKRKITKMVNLLRKYEKLFSCVISVVP